MFMILRNGSFNELEDQEYRESINNKPKHRGLILIIVTIIITAVIVIWKCTNFLN